MPEGEPLPFWILGSGPEDPEEPLAVDVRVKAEAEGLTAEKVQQLRSALAAFADDPPVTLERYELPAGTVTGGHVVAQGAPILRYLAQAVGPKAAAATGTSAAIGISAGGETLYRMVVDQRIAGQLAHGLARPMEAADGGIFGDILGKTGIIAKARFVPAAAEGGGAGLAAAGGGAAIGLGGAVVAAAPFVILAVAAASEIYAEEQRRRALERIESSLKELLANDLDQEMAAINGAMPALAKATSLLVDEGRLGASLGIDSAAYAIDTAIERARQRTQRWLQDVSRLSQRATVDQIEKSFPGVKDGDGRFVAELRMAGLAIAAKRRIMVLQAVEHAQLNQGLSLKRFLAEIDREATALNELEANLIDLLTQLSELPIRAGGGIFDRLHLSADAADELLKWPERLRDLRKREAPRVNSSGHIEIGIVLGADGRARILEPAVVAP
jgi:hypothetical protein